MTGPGSGYEGVGFSISVFRIEGLGFRDVGLGFRDVGFRVEGYFPNHGESNEQKHHGQLKGSCGYIWLIKGIRFMFYGVPATPITSRCFASCLRIMR